MKNPWVNYISRSYKSITSSVINRLKVSIPELKDYSPSNLLIVLIDIFAGIAEMINYYIDITARELFVPTARKFSSLLRFADSVNYLGKARLGASATVTFYAEDSGDVNIANPETFLIPEATILIDISGNYWETLYNQEFRAGFTNVSTAVKQQVTNNLSTLLGVSDGLVDQAIVLPANYMHGTLEITINAIRWEAIDNFQFSGPTDKHFQVLLKVDGSIYVQFGDNNNGLIPTAGQDIFGVWKTTNGADGQIGELAITTIDTVLTLPVGLDHLSVTNLERSYGGKAIEGLEDVRRGIPLSLYTLDRAVTRKDYEYVAALAPGVRHAFASFACGPNITLYIIGFEGGNPDAALLAEIKAYVEARSIFSIPIATAPSGETRIKGTVAITGAYRISTATIVAAADEALTNLYSPYTNSPRRAIHRSDIIAVLDNLPEIDYLTLGTYYAEPYLRPSNLLTVLDYTIEVLELSTQTMSWKLVYSSGSFSLLLEGTFIQLVNPGVQYNDIQNLINLYIAAVPGNVLDGDFWEFKSYPYSGDFKLEDYSIPVIEVGDFVYEITETYIK